MVKEDRSDWVAVEPQFQAASNDNAPAIRPAATAYSFFQKDITPTVKEELKASSGTFDVGQFSKAVRDKWNALDAAGRSKYDELARQDAARFAQESHQADVAAMERQRQRQQEREQLILDDEFSGQRGTRGSRKKELKKKAKKERKEKKQKALPKEGEWDPSYEDESSDSYEGSSDSDDSDRPKKKAAAPRKVSEAVLKRREQAREEKEEKEQYIAQRQADLRKDRADQAKRRLDFLLKQSDIFSHFGQVKDDEAKYQTKVTATSRQRGDGTSTHRDTVGAAEGADADDIEAQELDRDEQRTATFLTSQPSTLGFGKMRPYQLEGLNWMVRLQENGVNGILADEMGLGKTLQSISVLVYLQEYENVDGPHLIVVPKSTLSNWMTEIERWAPTLKAIRFHGSKEERMELARTVMEPAQRDENRDWNICVTTYEVCNIDQKVLNKFAWNYLIIDEAHRLKNEASSFSKTIRTFETRYRLLLTGTPLQNNLHELWALLNFLVPDVFASAEQFDEWFNLDIDDDDEKNKLISQLHKILRPFMLRRLKADVEKDLPPKHETILFTGMSAMQKKLYKDILMRDIDVVSGQGGGGSNTRTAILNIVMQLRKCAGHPYLFPGVEDRSLPPLGEHLVENCGKMVLLDKLLKRLKERGHRVLLFTQMTRILDILEDYMVMRQYKYCRIDGNTSYELREEYIDAYNAPDSEKFIFLLSTRAGGLGINLQTADVVILYDSDWNPQADLQAQDRAHRIGQKREVQVFRFVTEHTIEEKVVERAQQKLKLDAMVVQQGRLKEKDKLSSDELLAAVRFGADKVFKSKDSSISNDDIDLILDSGKRKTQELNEKLKAADKGDLLDFKLDDGLSAQTFEGVDYSGNALAKAAQAEFLMSMDIGKRERRTANYNENKLYQQQIAALQGAPKPKKKKVFKLPKSMRLPKLEEWQMYDRTPLLKIQEEEEKAFRALPEEQQKLANMKPADREAMRDESGQPVKLELPPLLDDEQEAAKRELLADAFSDWTRLHYNAFIKGSARYGRHDIAKIAKDVDKPLEEVEKYAAAFWDENMGKQRFSEHEYERVVKLIERGEKKIEELRTLQRGTRVFLSLFDNPWEELEFTYVNCKDKMFSAEEDRYLLCWAYKFGYGQWEAVKMAIRRHPNFRFDYFLRSLPSELIGRRCEQLMKAAEKEVEQLERKAREDAGMITEEEKKEGSDGEGNVQMQEPLPPIELPDFRTLRAQRRREAQREEEAKHQELETKVAEIDERVKEIRDRLKVLNEYSRESAPVVNPSAEFPDDLLPELANIVAKSGPSSITSIANRFSTEHPGQASKRKICSKIDSIAIKEKRKSEGDTKVCWYLRPDYEKLLSTETLEYLRLAREERLGKQREKEVAKAEGGEGAEEEDGSEGGAIGPDGEFVAFPEYDGSEPPKDKKKAFTHFCNGTRRQVKKSLDPAARKDKQKVNSILKEKWYSLSDEDKKTWKAWEQWDAKRHAFQLIIYKKAQQTAGKNDNVSETSETETETPQIMHVPKKRKSDDSNPDIAHIPKKSKK